MAADFVRQIYTFFPLRPANLPSRAQNRPFLYTDSSFFRDLSSNPAPFEDKSQFFRHLSSKSPYFEDSSSQSIAFSAGSGRAAAVQAKKCLPAATLPLFRLRRPRQPLLSHGPRTPPTAQANGRGLPHILPHRLTQNGSNVFCLIGKSGIISQLPPDKFNRSLVFQGSVFIFTEKPFELWKI